MTRPGAKDMQLQPEERLALWQVRLYQHMVSPYLQAYLAREDATAEGQGLREVMVPFFYHDCFCQAVMQAPQRLRRVCALW